LDPTEPSAPGYLTFSHDDPRSATFDDGRKTQTFKILCVNSTILGIAIQ
jgi:hypothetical protein